MFEFLLDAGNYESRKIDRIDPEDNNGVGVSTCYTSDEGYKTALLDANGAHLVERYETEEDAAKNHKKWIEFAKNTDNKEVTRLGWLDDFVEDEIIVLSRIKEE